MRRDRLIPFIVSPLAGAFPLAAVPFLLARLGIGSGTTMSASNALWYVVLVGVLICYAVMALVVPSVRSWLLRHGKTGPVSYFAAGMMVGAIIPLAGQAGCIAMGTSFRPGDTIALAILGSSTGACVALCFWLLKKTAAPGQQVRSES